MRIRYTWQPEEWTEALRLAAEKGGRRSSISGLTYVLVGIPVLGLLGDVIGIVRTNGGIQWKGTLAPVFLLGVVVSAVLLMVARRQERRRKLQQAAPMPQSKWEAVLKESGWSIRPVHERHDAFANDFEHGQPVPLGDNVSDPPRAASLASVPSTPEDLRPWNHLRSTRQGSRVVVLMTDTGFEAIPTRGLSEEQGGHLHRLLSRKLRPRPQ